MPIAAPLAARAIALALSASLALAAGAALAEHQTCRQIEERRARRQAGAGRLLRRLERLPQPVGQEQGLLRARPAQAARPRRSQARPRLRVHLRAAGRRRAQRSVAHHGLRRRRAGAADSDAKDSGEDAKDKKKDKKNEPVAPTAEVGDATFDLLPKGANLWVKNAAQESELIAEMRKGKTLVVKATSKKGNLTTDTYSLAGFAQAIDRALKDCAGG